MLVHQTTHTLNIPNPDESFKLDKNFLDNKLLSIYPPYT